LEKCRIFPIWFLLFSFGPLYGAQNPVPDSLRELAHLKQDSNPARLEALQKMLQERGIPYELQTFKSDASPHGRTKGANLVVTFGKGPREITLGAHYDALELQGGGMVDGMVDNGAAVTILVRVAEALKGRDLRHRVRVVFFDMEETGLVGSHSYVAAHKSDIDAAIILDVAGLGKDALIYGFGKAAGTDRVEKSLLMSCAEQLLTCIDSANYPVSDDRSFQNANIPVVSFAMGPRLIMYQFWLLLNGGENSGLEKGFMSPVFTIIHSPEDNISKIDPAALDLEYRIVLNTALKLDAAP
jgi:Zn-dependent M28 family amino/carboxypeptidase